MEKYYEAFVRQGFGDSDYALISMLNNQELKEMGVQTLKERLQILYRLHYVWLSIYQFTIHPFSKNQE